MEAGEEWANSLFLLLTHFMLIFPFISMLSSKPAASKVDYFEKIVNGSAVNNFRKKHSILNAAVYWKVLKNKNITTK